MKTKPPAAITLGSAAAAVGLGYSTFWECVYVRKIVPRPKWRVGRRNYYTAQTLAEAIATVQQLKAEGEL